MKADVIKSILSRLRRSKELLTGSRSKRLERHIDAMREHARRVEGQLDQAEDAYKRLFNSDPLREVDIAMRRRDFDATPRFARRSPSPEDVARHVKVVSELPAAEKLYRALSDRSRGFDRRLDALSAALRGETKAVRNTRIAAGGLGALGLGGAGYGVHAAMSDKKKNGLLAKLAELGASARGLNLYKAGEDSNSSFVDNHPWLTSIISGGAGAKIISDPRVISQATGTERLYHATAKQNIPGILENGLLTARSYDKDTITHVVGGARRAKKMSEGKVFAGRTKLAPRIMKLWIDKFGKKGPADILSIRIPYEKLNGLNPGLDPEYILAKERGPLSALASGIFGFGPRGTVAFEKDISPEYISRSSKFKHGLIEELKGIPRYAKNYPLRFAKGISGLSIGTALLGISARSVINEIKRRKKISRAFEL